MDKVREVVDKWPGKKTFGVYRFLPLFFLGGAALEYTMIHWHFNGVNFYKTYLKRKVHKVALKQIELEEDLDL